MTFINLPDGIERLLEQYVDRGDTLQRAVDDEGELLLGAILVELRQLNGRNDTVLLDDAAASTIGGATFNEQNWHVTETDVLDDVAQGGAVTLEPGDDEPLVRVEPDGEMGEVLAVGAKDQDGVVYYLRVDDDVHHGPTNTPLGTINSPYSFLQHGGTVPFDSYVEYRAKYLDSADGTVEAGARVIHYEPEA